MMQAAIGCSRTNCPYQFYHSHAILALVFPRKPRNDDPLAGINGNDPRSFMQAMDALMGSIGPIGRVLYDPSDAVDKLQYFMTGPVALNSDYMLGAQREHVILEPGCEFRVDRHDYSKAVNRGRGKCTICKQTWSKCLGHSPETFIHTCVLCSAKNRVKRQGINTAKCGRCQNQLFVWRSL